MTAGRLIQLLLLSQKTGQNSIGRCIKCLFFFFSHLPYKKPVLDLHRSDSPGHCAKYGTYSLIEDRINKVLDLQLVQVG